MGLLLRSVSCSVQSDNVDSVSATIQFVNLSSRDYNFEVLHTILDFVFHIHIDRARHAYMPQRLIFVLPSETVL